MLPIEAMRTAHAHVGPTVQSAFAEVLRRVNSGTRFADALDALPALLGPRALLLADTLSAADRDGLPLAPVLERLSVEARAQRRRDADARARQLPVRLAFPLVVCSLPAFVLLAVTPMLIAALSALTR
jgi:Flp pilus assembly protein TadB